MSKRVCAALLPLAIVGLCSVFPVAASPTTCETASAAVYAELTEGCTVGLFTLKNVAWSSVSGPGYVGVDASQVMIAPALVGSKVRVGVYSSAFSVTGYDQIFALLDYTLDPPPPILDDLSVALDAQSPVAPGYARVTANVCPGELFRNSCSTVLPPLVLVHYGDGNPNNVLSQTVVFPRPVNQIDVRLTLELVANGASSQIDGVVTDTGTVNDQPEVPEPSTAAMLFLGSGLAVVWRRRASR